jgi:hypothetical protein
VKWPPTSGLRLGTCNLTPFDTNWKEGSGATPLTTGLVKVDSIFDPHRLNSLAITAHSDSIREVTRVREWFDATSYDNRIDDSLT